MKAIHFVFVIAAGFIGYKSYKHFMKPSASEVQALTKVLSKALCDSKISKITETYAKALISETTAAADKLKGNERNTASILQAGVEIAQIGKQKTLEFSPQIKSQADPIFSSEGWNSARIAKVLKGMNYNAKNLIRDAVTQASASCGNEEWKKYATASAELVLKSYISQ